MRSLPSGWRGVLAKLGFHRKLRRRNAQLGRKLRIESLEDRRVLATLTVSSAADTGINTDGVLTLREAVAVVRNVSTSGLDSGTISNQISGSLGSNDTIVFSSSLNGATITLDRVNLGQIMIAGKSLTIDASMLSEGITIDASEADSDPLTYGNGIRIFEITGGGSTDVTMKNLTLTGGDAGPSCVHTGGVILSSASLGAGPLRNCGILNLSAAEYIENSRLGPSGSPNSASQSLLSASTGKLSLAGKVFQVCAV